MIGISFTKKETIYKYIIYFQKFAQILNLNIYVQMHLYTTVLLLYKLIYYLNCKTRFFEVANKTNITSVHFNNNTLYFIKRL